MKNVWWEVVCEDALSFKGDGYGAKSTSDKITQHNGIGTVSISGFYTSDFGRLCRFCGNCKTMGERHVKIHGVTAGDGSVTFVGINSNYGDMATITKSFVICTRIICEDLEENRSGVEPKSISERPNAAWVDTNADVTVY